MQVRRLIGGLTRRGTDESVCTPGSVPARAGGGHPSRPAVADRFQRPTRRLGRAALKRLRRPAFRPALLALLRVGFTEPPRSPGVLVGSYPTVSPLPSHT